MPIYEFICGGCGHEFEELVRVSEKPSCPSCGKSKLERLLSAPAAHVSGSGDAPCAARESGMCEPGGGCPGSCSFGG